MKKWRIYNGTKVLEFEEEEAKAVAYYNFLQSLTSKELRLEEVE